MNHCILWNSDVRSTRPAPSKNVHYSLSVRNFICSSREALIRVYLKARQQKIFLKCIKKHILLILLMKFIFSCFLFTWRTGQKLSCRTAPFEVVFSYLLKSHFRAQQVGFCQNHSPLKMLFNILGNTLICFLAKNGMRRPTRMLVGLMWSFVQHAVSLA